MIPIACFGGVVGVGDDQGDTRTDGAVQLEPECHKAAGAEQVGFPCIVKPIAGAGSLDTFRCNSEAELETALKQMGHVEEVSVEEFIDGEEFTYDTICAGGRYDGLVEYLGGFHAVLTHSKTLPEKIK